MKSSIGLISSKISARPDFGLMSVRPAASAYSVFACQESLPISQLNESIWRSRRFGTSKGSGIFAKEIRPLVEMTLVFFDAVREVAKMSSFQNSQRFYAC